jgi:hypothetical protein
MIEMLIKLYILFSAILFVVQGLIIVKEKEKKYEVMKQFKKCEGELLEYKIREISPIPSMQQISYNYLKEKVDKYKPPYEIGQKVIYNDRTYVRIGYISEIKTEHCEIVNPDNESKELVITHTYEIEGRFYTDIIDVVKEKENEK